jgi:hypothetical protein
MHEPTKLPDIESEQISHQLIDPAIVGAYPTGKSVALTGAAMTSSTGTVSAE